ncbi:protein Shroom4 isoform X1 [Astyanax mexicanus]|uniref:protein Shroom4 isoform X1 n=2 Tax=Astyanax mexicanus TaxID=7994 RepID=UPI0020CB1002|nr:protein Shroom4 isoform X1 [Astyanax mexicanus]
METVEQLVSFNHIHVQLNGGAPWGFTLKGGLEHGEPLIITKIEEGGKAAQCKKLKVGDELVNINGSALYGSRQEALILIKGSYRILKIVVRRRTVPLIRPHSWHLAKVSEPLSLPGQAGSPDGPLAMQLHPPPTFSVPWHSGGDSRELSMQLGHLSSTDHSSSLGSMESLENPSSQGYYDNQLSPIDPAIFNNKRDSAYSSFSASSNTSDYTVSLRPEENSSMDSLLQGLGPSCRFIEGRPHSAASGPGELHCEDGSLKSRSLPHRPEAKVRPSSYGYEEEKCGPPQPPMRKDSFRATRGRPGVADKRCVSAPVGIPVMNNCLIESPSHTSEGVIGSGCLKEAQENGQDLVRKGNRAEPYYTLSSQRELFRDNHDGSTGECNKNPSRLKPLERCSSQPSPPPTEINEPQLGLEDSLQTRMHRHSAPEKLLASQLHMMELSSDNSEHSMSPNSQWSHSLHSRLELRENSPDVASQGKWEGSRCSTPGSLTTSELDEQRLEDDQFDSGQSLSPIHPSWGRSASVPGEPTRNGFSGSGSSLDSDLLERDFGPISAAASMDTLIEEDHDRGGDEVEISKPPQKRQFRSSKSRRRNERFATNLRNEIQRKKAQLQKSTGQSGLLFGEDTVKEEDSANFQVEDESQAGFLEISQTRTQTQSSNQTTPALAPSQPRRTTSNSAFQEDSEKHCGINPVEHTSTCTEDSRLVSQHETQGFPSTDGIRPVCVRVVEEVAPAGKARRWRWTPENKLQPEVEVSEKKSVKEITPPPWKPQTTRARVGSSSGRSSRTDDCDILPFADRRKFFEETIRNLSQSVTNLASLTSRRQRPEKQGKLDEPSSPDPPRESVPELGRRRFSYQGGVHDGTSVSSLEARRQFVSTQRERDRERERMVEIERKREKEREREKEKERQREKERLREQERIKEQERFQAWKKEQDEQKEREREMANAIMVEREQERVQHVEEKWEMDRDVVYAGHDVNNTIMPPPLPHGTHQNQQYLSQSGVTPYSSHPDNSYIQSVPDIQKPCSAFRPVMSHQYQSDHCCLHPGNKARSCTPTEAYPVRELEQTKLNRKFSLTERDYPHYRRDSRPVEVTVAPGFQSQWNNNNRLRFNNNENQPFRSSLLRNRAMSENDLRVLIPCLQSHLAANTNSGRMSSTLRELDENIPSDSEEKKKKGPPPPRPPPPKWGQFHMRRASHHNLFSSPPAPSPPPQTYTSRPPLVTELTRQRSYSLPPRDGMENCQQCHQECPVAPPSPAFSRRAFKPVAPPPKEQDVPPTHHYDMNSEIDPPPAVAQVEQSTRLPHPTWRLPSDQYQPPVVKPVFHKHRAEWDLTNPHNSSPTNSTSRSSGPNPSENGSYPGAVPPESYFTMNNNNTYQQHLQNWPQQTGAVCKHLEPSTQTPLPIQEQTLPLETDIDEVHEDEGTSVEQQSREEGGMEMQCFAQPVTVLETDIDTVTEEEAPLAGMRRGQRVSLVDSFLEKDCEKAGKELMVELFPQCTDTGSGGEGWRGGYPVNVDTLERSSRQLSSTSHALASTTYSDSTSKAQLFNKMSNFSEVKEGEEELNYKKQLIESLRKKLGVLHDAQRGLQEDIRANAQLGEEVESLVLAVCKPNEVDKYRMFIGDLDKVTSLLLSLSGRLLRVESALDCLDPESGHTERLPLLEKKKQLLAQLAEAQELKEHVDRREQAVGRVLGRCLTPEQLRDYSHFVKMKAALLVEQRQLDDKIRLGEEQLRGLRESLGMGMGLGLGLGLGVGLGYGH